MTIDEWQERLETTFDVDGIVGGHLLQVYERESDIRNRLLNTFRGQNVLIDSFQSFYIETLNLALDLVGKSGWPPPPNNYPLAFAKFHSLFRRYRACEVLFYSGYPLEASGDTQNRPMRDG